MKIAIEVDADRERVNRFSIRLITLSVILRLKRLDPFILATPCIFVGVDNIKEL